MLQTVGELAREVREMRSSKQTVGGATSLSLRGEDFASQRQGVTRDEVLSQVRELREREKRVDSIILKRLSWFFCGFSAGNFYRVV